MIPELGTIDVVPLADDPRTPPAEDAAPEPSPPGDLGPIKAAERIAEMDILRGFALLGICVINLQNFLGPNGIFGDSRMFPAWYDRTAEFLINLFGSGKFNAMFSFLFGVGFAIQMERADRSKVPFASMYLRRLVALFLFGAAHLILLWDGDVLHIYAALGLPLIFCRKLRDRWIWGLAVLTLVAPILFVMILTAFEEKVEKTDPKAEARVAAKKEKKAHESYDRGVERLKLLGRGEYVIPPYMPMSVRKQREEAKDTTPVPATVKVVAESTYPAVVKYRVREWLKEMREGGMVFWSIFGTTLLIGFIAGRRRIFHDIPGHLRFIRRLTVISGVIGIGLAMMFATAVLLAPPGEKLSLMGILAGLGYILGRPFLCAFYIGIIILLAQTDRFRRLLTPLALVGRMPLTNYLMHSVVFSLLFYGYGLGLFYRIGPALSVPIAFTLYGIQVAYSTWWMKRFRFGPMEWLWRTLTYGKPPAMTTPSPIP